MLEGKLDQTWARWTRPWTTVAWMFLTVGVALGSWWAYYELGWGGWWAWDPVENSILMPWLLCTALIHSLAVTDKRGLFKSWTLLLAIMTFSFCLLATFMVRSGVLVSVHSFAADPARGVFILAFLVLDDRWRAVAVCVARAVAALQGRLRPHVARELPAVQQHPAGDRHGGGVRRHHGAVHSPTCWDWARCRWARLTSIPLSCCRCCPLLALVSIGVFSRWKRGGLGDSKRRVLGSLVLAVVIGLGVILGVYGDRSLLGPIGVVLGAVDHHLVAD